MHGLSYRGPAVGDEGVFDLLDIREMRCELAREFCKIVRQDADCTRSALVLLFSSA